MFKFNSQCIPDSRQCPIDGIKEVIATSIVLRSDPFGLHYPPQGFRKVQVRGIRRKVKEETQGSGEGNTAEGKRGKAHVSPTALSVPVLSCSDVRSHCQAR